jgi:hypothetical protein
MGRGIGREILNVEFLILNEEEEEEFTAKPQRSQRKAEEKRKKRNVGFYMLNFECPVSFSELGKLSVAHLAWTQRSGVKNSEGL